MRNERTLEIRAGAALFGPDLLEVADATILVRGGIIVGCGAAGDVTVPAGTPVVDASRLTLMPGFIDAHVHIGFVEPAAVVRGGVTTVRDLGWPLDEIGRLMAGSEAPGSEGPAITAVGPILTAPGGYPTRAGWAPRGTGLEVDSPGAAQDAVHSLAKWGASAIKIALNPPAGPVLDTPTLTAITETARSVGLRTTGHVTGLDQLDRALDTGLDELAHMLMSYEAIPDDTIERMVAAGMVVVPTLAVRSGADLDQAVDNLWRFAAAGGRIVYGTDLGNNGPQPGIDALEVAAMAAAGMAPPAIIGSATAEAAAWLGLGDRGILEPGRRADIIGVAGEPTARAADLTNVELVVRAGRVIKGS
ncbi:MAG: amidohydrolase family protein [Actinomycetota bacterium]